MVRYVSSDSKPTCSELACSEDIWLSSSALSLLPKGSVEALVESVELSQIGFPNLIKFNFSSLGQPLISASRFKAALLSLYCSV